METNKKEASITGDAIKLNDFSLPTKAFGCVKKIQNQQEFLVDKRANGKKRDWAKYKKSSLAVSEAYKELGEDHRKLSIRIEECGDFLHFISCPHQHEKKLIRANFCKARLCPMCQKRRSLIISNQVLDLMHQHLKSLSQ